MALRYFKEDYPELHVIAAGSLLEFALEEISSFGVGRIRFEETSILIKCILLFDLHYLN